MIKRNKKIGILGGTFDPCHIGHLKISKEAKRKFKLKKLIWAVTKRNPFKEKSNLSLETRLKISNRFTKKYKFIQINHFEKLIKSSRTFDLLNYLKNQVLLLLAPDGLNLWAERASKLLVGAAQQS